MSADVLLLLVILAALLLCRVPVSVSLIATGAFATLVIEPNAQMSNLVSIGADQSMGFVFTVVPMFVLMGEVLRRTKVASDVFLIGDRALRRLPGGMLHASNVGCTAFAAVSGSSPVTASTVGSLTIPQMLARNYPPRLAVGVVAAGGTLGILIPPSVGLIVYGVITSTSIGDLFLAGIIPGLGMSLLFMLTTAVLWPRYSRKEAERARAEEAPAVVSAEVPATETVAEHRSVLQMSLSVVSVLALFVLVIGGIYRGVFTPTESAAIGAAGALLVALTVGGLRSLREYAEALRDTVLTTGMFLLLLIGGLFVAYVVTVMGLPQDLARFVGDLAMPSWAVMLVLTAILVVLGMFLDPMSMLVIMAPLLLPTVVAMGYSPVWFGIFFMLAVEIGMVTPPVGLNLFVLRRVVPQISFAEITRGAALYLPAFGVGIVALLLVPDIALFLTQR